MSFAFQLLVFIAAAQDMDPVILLDSARNKIASVNSYSADALIKVDVDFLKMKERKAHITYKYPNKLDIDSKGFVLLPKFGFRPFMKTINSEDNMAVYSGRETINDETCHVLKLLPREDGKIVMLKLWIRTSDYLVQQSETFTRRSGNILVQFQYENEVLPSKMIFNFETKGINIPWKLVGNSIELEKSKVSDDKITNGKVSIEFSNYEINAK